MNTLNNKHNQFQKQHQNNEIQCIRLLFSVFIYYIILYIFFRLKLSNEFYNG